MASITEILAGLADRFRTIPGLQIHKGMPDALDPPAVAITLESCNYDSTQSRGSDDLVFVARVFTSAATDRDGQAKLFGYIDGSGTTSVKEAIEEDVTLGGAADFAVVAEARAPGIVEYDDLRYYAVDFAINVSVIGSVLG